MGILLLISGAEVPNKLRSHPVSLSKTSSFVTSPWCPTHVRSGVMSCVTPAITLLTISSPLSNQASTSVSAASGYSGLCNWFTYLRMHCEKQLGRNQYYSRSLEYVNYCILINHHSWQVITTSPYSLAPKVHVVVINSKSLFSVHYYISHCTPIHTCTLEDSVPDYQLWGLLTLIDDLCFNVE